MDSERHPIDQWHEEALKSQADFMSKREKEILLMKSVFCSGPGALLLERWKDQLMYQSTANAGDDMLSIGMREGYKNFIRSIIHATTEVEQ